MVATLGTLVAPATWDPYEIPQAGYTHYENQLHVICFIYSPPLNAPKNTHSKHVQNKAENCLIHNWMQWSTVKNTPAGFGRSVREFFTDQLTRGNPVLNERFFAGFLAIMSFHGNILGNLTILLMWLKEFHKPSPRSRYFYRYVDTIPSH